MDDHRRQGSTQDRIHQPVNQPQILVARLAQLARDRGEQFLPVGQFMFEGQQIAGRKLQRRGQLEQDLRRRETLAALQLAAEFVVYIRRLAEGLLI